MSAPSDDPLVTLFDLVGKYRDACNLSDKIEKCLNTKYKIYFNAKKKFESIEAEISCVREDIIQKETSLSEWLKRVLSHEVKLVAVERALVQAQNNVGVTGSNLANIGNKIKQCRFFVSRKLRRESEAAEKALAESRRQLSEAERLVANTRRDLCNTQKECAQISKYLDTCKSKIVTLNQSMEESEIAFDMARSSYLETLERFNDAKSSYVNLRSQTSRKIDTYISSHPSVVEAIQEEASYQSKKKSLEEQLSELLESIKADNPHIMSEIRYWKSHMEECQIVMDNHAPDVYSCYGFHDGYIHTCPTRKSTYVKAANEISKVKKVINELEDTLRSHPEYVELLGQIKSLKRPNIMDIKTSISRSIWSLTPPSTSSSTSSPSQ